MKLKNILIALVVILYISNVVVAERTLFADYIYSSAQPVTIVNEFESDIINAAFLGVETFTLHPLNNIVFDTAGDVALDGSFLSLTTGGNLDMNVAGEFVDKSSGITGFLATDVDIAGDSFSMNTRNDELNIIADNDFSGFSDSQSINSEGPVHFNSQSGTINFFADDKFSVDSIDTEIVGTERVTVFALHTTEFQAEETLNFSGDIVDIDSLGELTLTADIDINLNGGHEVNVEGITVNMEGTNGVDFTSRDSEIRIITQGELQDIEFVSENTVEMETVDDIYFNTGSEIDIFASVIIADIEKTMYMDTYDEEATADIDVDIPAGATAIFHSLNDLEVEAEDVLIDVDTMTTSFQSGRFESIDHQWDVGTLTLTTTTENSDIIINTEDMEIDFQFQGQFNWNAEFITMIGNLVEFDFGDDQFRQELFSITLSATDNDTDMIMIDALDTLNVNGGTVLNFDGTESHFTGRLGVTMSAGGEIEFMGGSSNGEGIYMKGFQDYNIDSNVINMESNGWNYFRATDQFFWESTDVAINAEGDVLFNSLALEMDIGGLMSITNPTGFVNIISEESWKLDTSGITNFFANQGDIHITANNQKSVDSPLVYQSNNFVPFDDSLTTTDVITVTDNHIVRNLKVGVSFDYINLDFTMTIDLTSPSGTTRRLYADSCTGTDSRYNFIFSDLGESVCEFTQYMSPSQSLDAYDDEPINGDWTLTINSLVDEGVLINWYLVNDKVVIEEYDYSFYNQYEPVLLTAPSVTSFPLVVGDVGTIENIEFEIDIDFDDLGLVTVQLQSPTTTVTVINGGDCDNKRSFSGSFAIDEGVDFNECISGYVFESNLLENFVETNAKGIWNVIVTIGTPVGNFVPSGYMNDYGIHIATRFTEEIEDGAIDGLFVNSNTVTTINSGMIDIDLDGNYNLVTGDYLGNQGTRGDFDHYYYSENGDININMNSNVDFAGVEMRFETEQYGDIVFLSNQSGNLDLNDELSIKAQNDINFEADFDSSIFIRADQDISLTTMNEGKLIIDNQSSNVAFSFDQTDAENPFMYADGSIYINADDFGYNVLNGDMKFFSGDRTDFFTELSGAFESNNNIVFNSDGNLNVDTYDLEFFTGNNFEVVATKTVDIEGCSISFEASNYDVDVEGLFIIDTDNADGAEESTFFDIRSASDVTFNYLNGNMELDFEDGNIISNYGTSGNFEAGNQLNILGLEYIEINIGNEFGGEENLIFGSDTIPEDSIIVFESTEHDLNMGLNPETVANSDNMYFNGGDIDISAASTKTTEYYAMNDISFDSLNENDIMFTNNFDFNVTAFDGLRLTTNNKDEDGYGLKVWSTNPQSDIWVLAKAQDLIMETLMDMNLNSDSLDIFAGSDVIFETTSSLLNTGYLSFVSSSSIHDPIYGNNVGMAFRTRGDEDGDSMYILAKDGKMLITNNNDENGENIELSTTTGDISFESQEKTMLTAKDSNMNVNSHRGLVEFLTEDNGDFTVTTKTDANLASYGELIFSSGEKLTIASTNSNKLGNDNELSDGIGVQFSTDNTNILVMANSDNDIHFKSNRDSNISLKSGQLTFFRSASNQTFTATNGVMSFVSETSQTVSVANGDLEYIANQNIDISTDFNSNIYLNSGNNGVYTANNEDIELTANTDDMIFRTEGNDISVKTLTSGSINFDTTGILKFQSDGTDNNSGVGTGVDGIHVTSNSNIQIIASDNIVFESEDIITIGETTTPLVDVEAGGDSVSDGIILTSVGNIDLITENDFEIDATGSVTIDLFDSLDLLTDGPITISTTSTSTRGKDISFKTATDFAINAETIEYTGNTLFTLESLDSSVLIESDDANIELSSASDFHLNVNQTSNFDSNNWNMNSNDFDFFSLGDITFDIGRDVSITADSAGLVFQSDLDLDFMTINDNSDLSISTLESNSRISFNAKSETSDLVFVARQAALDFVTSNDIIINSFEDITIAAIDIVDDDDIENGDITFLADNDFLITSDSNMIIESVETLTFQTSNSNGADINIQSFGSLFLESFDDVNVISQFGDIEMTSDSDFNIKTTSTENNINNNNFNNNGGNLNVDSTRDLTFTMSADSLNEVFGNVKADTTEAFTFNVNNELDFQVNGTGSKFLIDSQQGNFLMSLSGNAAGGLFEFYGTQGLFEADRTIQIISGNEMQFRSFGDHSFSNLTSSDGQALFTSGTNNINFNTLIGGDLSQLRGYSTTVFEAASSLPNPSDNNLSASIFFQASNSFSAVSSEGRNSFYAHDDSIEVTSSTSNVEFTSNSGLAQIYRANGDDSLFSVHAGTGIVFSMSTSDLEFNVNDSDGNGLIDLQTIESILTFSANSIDESASARIISTHSNGDIQFISTDFLNGDNRVASNNDMVFSAHDQVIFQVVDDDDAQPIGTLSTTATSHYQFSGSNIDIDTTVDGDIFMRTHNPNSYFNFLAAQDINNLSRDDISITSNDDLNLSSSGGIEFNNQGGDISLTTTAANQNNFLAKGGVKFYASGAVGSDIFIHARSQDLTLTAGIHNNYGFQDVYTTGGITVNSQNLIQFTTTDADSVIDIEISGYFRPREFNTLVIPHGNFGGVVNGVTCGIGTGFQRDRSLLFDTFNSNLCICDDGAFRCLPMTNAVFN